MLKIIDVILFNSINPINFIMQVELVYRYYLMPDGRFARFEFGVSVIVIYLLFVIWFL